nr:CHAD domain-containing protein [Gammaproteobacteria bacterium]
EDLHELRKTCKKLRYLMEFFQNLYPPKEIKALIKALKVLQDNLGDFQDLEVQALNLTHFSEQMVDEGTVPPQTLMAMGMLVDGLSRRQHQAREEFAARFGQFAAEDIRSQFQTLFAAPTRAAA